MEKLPIDMLEADSSGALTAADGTVSVSAVQDTSVTEFGGNFDTVSGALTISIPNVGSITINGLLTLTAVGAGPQGISGLRGVDGVDGLTPRDGRQGADGCVGSVGPVGADGGEGPRGIQGPQGFIGVTGARGERGPDGRFRVFFQADEPVGDGVEAGTIWVRPRAS